MTPDPRGKFVPVVMVHGWTGKATHNDTRTGAFSHLIDLSTNRVAGPSVPRSLIGEIQRIPGAEVYTFDYHDYSARWIDDSHQGPALGTAIDCLFKATGEKVIVVAHSMGGLVARWALTHPGPGGEDRSREVSTVVTLGTPETGSLMAELVNGAINVGADAGEAGVSSMEPVAVLRLILAGCGSAVSKQLETGTPCDFLPAFVTAFDSDAGKALREGSSQLAALKPFPKNIVVDAIAGDTTIKVPPGAGWFGLPWSTKDVPMGDMIVTTSSATQNATMSTKGSCAYQLNPVRLASDNLGLILDQVGKTDVAQPIWSVQGPCFHTNLMRTLELTNEVAGAVADDINSRAPVTANDLLSAPVPAVCTHEAGQLVNGTQPGITAHDGFMQLAALGGGAEAAAALTALGDLDGDGTGDAATLLDCNAGGVSWPQIIAFYSHGPTLLGWAYLTDFNLPGIQPQENAVARRITYHDGGIDIEWSTQEENDPGALSSLDYSATLRLSGRKIVASSLVGTTESKTVNTFIDDLRHGDQSAASQLAAPYVGAVAASQFRSYPSALAATPTCYGLNDVTMPAPLAALVDPGGPAQLNPDPDRLCALPSTDPGANWIALGMRHTGFRTWQILWSDTI